MNSNIFLRFKILLNSLRTKKALLKNLTVEHGFAIEDMITLYSNLRARQCNNDPSNKITVALEMNAIDVISFRVSFRKGSKDNDLSFHIRASKDGTKYVINIKRIYTDIKSIYTRKIYECEYEFADRVHPDCILYRTRTERLNEEVYEFMKDIEYAFKHIIKETINWYRWC